MRRHGRSMLRSFVGGVAAAAAVGLLPIAAGPASGQPAESSVTPSRAPSADGTIAADFTALATATATSRVALEPLERALDALAARRRAEAGDLGFSRARAGLDAHREALARFAAFAALVPSWRDLGHEADLLLATVKPEDVDVLAAAVGGTAGHDVGTALAAYRQAVGALAAAATPLRERLAAERDRDRLAGEARGGRDDPRYRQLVAQYGETLADASVYVPSSPPELHRPRTAPAEKVFDVALLWDEAEDEWFRLPGDVPIEEIFRDVFIAAGKRPTPGQLKYLAGIYPQVKARQATVDALAAWLRAAATGAGPAAQAFAAAPDAAAMRAALDEPWRLRARYVYDAAYRQSTLAAVDQVRKALVGQGTAATAALRSLDALLDRHGLTLESQWAVAVASDVGTVKVTAWFRDDPKTRFVSTWRFDKEQVRIEIDQGRANGVRRGNTVETEGSIPGRNCVATDRRSFAPNGTLTFSASYRCIRDDGRIEVNDRIGAGTWEVVPAAASPDGKPAAAAEPQPDPRREPARRPR